MEGTVPAAMEAALACWVCLEAVDSPGGAATEPTGCACRGSAGRAHMSCLVDAARHSGSIATANSAALTAEGDHLWAAHHTAWLRCPTCKQSYNGPMAVGLARARWAAAAHSPEEDEERLDAQVQLCTALMNSGDSAGARPLSEELVTVLRRTCGSDIRPRCKPWSAWRTCAISWASPPRLCRCSRRH